MACSARHVSRWRLCQAPEADHSAATLSSSSQDGCSAVEKAAASTPPVSLRYLNEFVGKLHCAPALLQHGLFPDAKEVTESMALFNAVRRYFVACKSDQPDEDLPDGIVVVGDGNTPRTAVMFAFRMRGWKCYSIDPAMEKNSSDRSKGWADVANLVVIRNKIENVRIKLRRAIVVLVHAHVTLEQALSAVQAEEICGVVTMPCCNWYSRQEELFGRGPDLVYDDFSVLSDKREIRLWVGGESNSDVNTSHADFSSSASVMKGCVRKELVVSDEPSIDGRGIHPIITEKLAQELDKKHDGVLDFIGNVLGELARDASTMTQEEYFAEEQTIGSSLPSAVASHLARDSHVLALGWHPRRLAVRLLLRAGYTNVYTISMKEKVFVSVDGNSNHGTKRLQLQLYKCGVNLDADGEDEEVVKLEPCGYFTLHSSFSLSSTGDEGEESNEEQTTVLFNSEGTPTPPLECVLDAGFLFRGFRGRANKSPAFFRQLCVTLGQIVSACGYTSTSIARNASLVCLTPRKQWCKKDYLAHEDLGYDVQSLIAVRKQFPGTPVFVYCCFQRQKLHDLAVVPSTNTAEINTTTRDAAIATWQQLENHLKARQRELVEELVVIDSPSARVKAAEDEEQAVAAVASYKQQVRKVYVQVTGEISRVRKFSNGMAFLSLELAGSGYDRPLQVFLQRETLNWSPSKFATVVSLFRRGDELVAVGFMTRNTRGHSMLQVEALSLARSGQFESFN